MVHREEDFDLIMSQLLNSVETMDFSENRPNTTDSALRNNQCIAHTLVRFHRHGLRVEGFQLIDGIGLCCLSFLLFIILFDFLRHLHRREKKEIQSFLFPVHSHRWSIWSSSLGI